MLPLPGSVLRFQGLSPGINGKNVLPHPRHCHRPVPILSPLLHPNVSRCLARLTYLTLPTICALPHRGQSSGFPSSSTCTISFSPLSLRTRRQPLIPIFTLLIQLLSFPHPHCLMESLKMFHVERSSRIQPRVFHVEHCAQLDWTLQGDSSDDSRRKRC